MNCVCICVDFASGEQGAGPRRQAAPVHGTPQATG